MPSIQKGCRLEQRTLLFRKGNVQKRQNLFEPRPGRLVENPQTAQVLARNELSLIRFRAGAVANRAERHVQETEIRRSKDGALPTN